MQVHQDILEVVNKQVLPNIVRVHEMDVPYPAELWVDGNCKYQDGTAMFSIGDRGFLTAEYFAYDNTDRLLRETIGLQTVKAKLIMKTTEVEIPIWWLSNSHKARTRYSICMPALKVYECEVQGWIGGPDDTPMQSATITLSGLPNLHLPKTRVVTSEESTYLEAMTMRGMETKNAILTLEAGGWKIRLTEGTTDWQQKSEPLYHATLAREDGSPFTLNDDDLDNGIVEALRKFLSFQCEAWVNISTIRCNPVFSITEKSLPLSSRETSEDIINLVRELVRELRDPENESRDARNKLEDALHKLPEFEDVAEASLSELEISEEYARMSFSKGNPFLERAWIGELSPRNASYRSNWTASDWMEWPDLFKEFWAQYKGTKSGNFLNTAVRHYVDCKRILEDGTLGYAMVAAKSTLEVLTRWWNDLGEDFYFGSGKFEDQLKTAVHKAELGKDDGKQVDTIQLTHVMKTATKYRNKIDHGQDSDIAEETERVYAHQSNYHNLARLLILAKLGDRSTSGRGEIYTPSFTEKQ